MHCLDVSFVPKADTLRNFLSLLDIIIMKLFYINILLKMHIKVTSN